MCNNCNKRKLIIFTSSATVTFEGSPARISTLENFLVETHVARNGVGFTPTSNQLSIVMDKISEIFAD